MIKIYFETVVELKYFQSITSTTSTVHPLKSSEAANDALKTVLRTELKTGAN